ncbi:DUF4080 domain-containing protein [Pontiella sulfatireligans]|uniref:Uncharacterized protein n=1 Tax=Pontiella sulfatireligans TaxID=2750658 RepID=A0A6C2US00_9BACT|nr:DUF4080 domain-containing protein [Pontiella sulfatireligans]VGO22034.1 hypothetical protein SCARR_04115 [Pontiella sulfatireligans]
MADILLAAFNARYAHTSFGARYLLANMGDLREHTELMEFDLQVQSRIAVEKILALNPRIVGIGCYIWNIDLATKVAAQLKRIRPDIQLILGGPEISYETEEQEIFQYADHVICGEGETEFPKLCGELLGRRDACDTTSVPQASRLPRRIIRTEAVNVAQIELPYDLYTDEDIAHRAIYVEASRGCPFRCEYCMSSLDPCVRYFPEEQLFATFGRLLDRGARIFKFVDRTFNIDIAFALKILAFFRKRYEPGMMLHFEVIPSHLPDELMEAVADCPPGMLQFEVGIQTFNEEVAHRIQRPLDIEKIEANMRRLRNETDVHIHSDLIAGLPGEDLESFEAGFNRLLALNPQEIQLGILKRLRGAPIDRHSKEWDMVYSPHAPYEILCTSLIPFEEMQRINRFARYWNLTVNNGQFINAAPLIWTEGRRDACDTSGSVPQASRLPENTGFNPLQPIEQSLRKKLPHWTQDHCTYFVTFRLADSIAQSRVKEYEELRRKWQEHHHPPYSEKERERFNELFSERVNEWLDAGSGSCCFKEPELAQIVADTLTHFDGERYELNEWVVMPNHVHVLVKPLEGYKLSDILHSWKSFSAHEINKATGQEGIVWQPESYDHIVRDVEELNRIRNYIRENPEKAGVQGCPAGSRRDACDTSGSVPQASRLPSPPSTSPFAAFMQWSNWLYAKTNTTGNLHMVRLAKLLLEFLTSEKGMDEKTVAEALWRDYQRGNRPDIPGFLKKFEPKENHAESGREACDTKPVPQVIAPDRSNLRLPRQQRHLKD